MVFGIVTSHRPPVVSSPSCHTMSASMNQPHGSPAWQVLMSMVGTRSFI